MSTPSKAVTKPEERQPGERILETLLGLAKTPEERERAYALAERFKQQRVIAAMSEELAKLSWGEKITEVARAQVVRYAMEIGADPLRHLYVLGNRVYLNGEFYRELVAELPDFVRPETTWLHPDKRASEEENAKRLNLRIEHAVPDEVAGKPILAAALVTLFFKDRGPFTGAKWSPSNKNDPVGTEFPTLTAESRAWRRAAMKAVGPWFQRHPLAARAEEILVQGRESERRAVALPPIGQTPVVQDEVPIAQIAAPAPEKPKTVRHNPNALCQEADWHPRAECKLETA